MTQTVPRLMSSPLERTDTLLRLESGQAAANAITAGVPSASGTSSSRSDASRAASRRPSWLPANLKFTWAHAVGYPLEGEKAGGQRPRLKRYHRDRYGNQMQPTPEVTEALTAKGLIQDQAPLPRRFEEIDAIAGRFGRDRAPLTRRPVRGLPPLHGR